MGHHDWYGQMCSFRSDTPALAKWQPAAPFIRGVEYERRLLESQLIVVKLVLGGSCTVCLSAALPSPPRRERQTARPTSKRPQTLRL